MCHARPTFPGTARALSVPTNAWISNPTPSSRTSGRIETGDPALEIPLQSASKSAMLILRCGNVSGRDDNPGTFSQSRDPGILRDSILGYPGVPGMSSFLYKPADNSESAFILSYAAYSYNHNKDSPLTLNDIILY